jgi:hypothetical protein
MSSYPPPPYKLPPAYLPLPHGQLGPSDPLPFPNPQQFWRSAGQFHPASLTKANARRNPVLKQMKPYPSPGPMRWPQQQFQPQKWVTQYAGPDQDLAGCGCGTDSSFGAILGEASIGTKVALAAVLAISVVTLLSKS